MNSKEIAKLELLIVTAAIAIAFLFSLFNSGAAPNLNNEPQSLISTVTGNFLPNFFDFLVISISYILLSFYVTPELNKKEGAAKNGVLLTFTLISIGFISGVINVFWATLLAIKIIYILITSDQKKNELQLEAGYLVSFWIIITSVLFFSYTNSIVKLYALLVVPFVIMLYLYAIYSSIPKSSKRVWKRTRYFYSMLFMAAFSTAILAMITIPITLNNYGHFNNLYITFFNINISIKELLTHGDKEANLLVVLLGNFLTQLILVTPIAWRIYKDRNALKTEEIVTLKTELGKADANLNFLKSQINPHFLFNALNTLYGTALQEKAERTGEGIQRLGDMMRFMLQENVEDKILLSKDIDYLNNYIALQKLRTSTSDGIIIEIQIEEQINGLLISPMLLIPFVENAFKHGISLQSPSHIKITLQTSGKTLYFDVHNSLHLKQNNDPEKLQTGIGLQNVRQRLDLLYPDQHELIIRENAKEFFIHLTLQLSGND
ncbi:Histidine kinase [Pedobacter sp. ok626]|uniref:sensor histidine kinase n=1 Tax=Pedobacter sp. ok626 TaxID=1761882 RepID=UPI000882E980|nr:histidine kinase [Pedobacter sp. ok626]SDJ24965.1 Histidine kinase [Pedobacter sp. ok626]